MNRSTALAEEHINCRRLIRNMKIHKILLAPPIIFWYTLVTVGAVFWGVPGIMLATIVWVLSVVTTDYILKVIFTISKHLNSLVT